MSKWTIQKYRGNTVVVCEDLGEIISFNLVNEGNCFSAVNKIREYEICCQTLPIRYKGMVPIAISFQSLEKEGFDGVVREPASDNGDRSIREQDLLGVIYHGGGANAFCIDPRILALIDGSVDLMFKHAKSTEYKKLYNHIPSREKAREYLRTSGFTYGGFYTDKEIEERIPQNEWGRVSRKVGAVSILLD